MKNYYNIIKKKKEKKKKETERNKWRRFISISEKKYELNANNISK